MLCRCSKNGPLRARTFLITIAGVNLLLTAWTPPGRPQSPLLGQNGGEISGTVLVVTSNRPAAQAVISLRSSVAGVSRSILTDFAGHFDVRGLPPGVYEVVAEEAGYDPVLTKVELAGNLLNLVLHLKPNVPSNLSRNNATVSVRELRIPEEAHHEYQRGLESLGRHDPQESLKHFAKATAAFREYYEAQYHAGVAELQMGHKEEAMQDFLKALELSEGRYARAQFGVGALLCESGKPKEAEPIVRKGLELDDSMAEGHVLLGIALVEQHRMEEAEKSAREALLRDSRSAEAYLVLSDVHASRREYHSQLQDLERYLA